jgi:hypothetical protein
MPAPSYLLKSRHGIYYFRIRISGLLQKRAGKPCKEMRLSLNTKDKQMALYLSRKLWVFMKERTFLSTSLKPEDWETEAETERETYLQGKDLIESFGRADPTDAFALDCLGEHLSNDQLKAYVFAWGYDEQHRQNCPSSDNLEQISV